MRRWIWNRARVIALVGALSLPAAAMAVDVGDFMDEMYLSASSSPALVETQSRMGISGGSFHLRSPIRNINVYNFAPPGIEIGGCGGVSLFGGAFSMINVEEAIELMRQIGSQALSVAFSLALRIISETLFQNIKEKLDEVMEWTRKFRDTCEAAHALVDASGIESWMTEMAKTYKTSTGASSDAGALAMDEADEPGGTVADVVESQGKDTIPMHGNRLWNAMEKNDEIKFGPLLGVSETRAREIAMSILGTSIACKESDRSPADARDPHASGFPPILSLTDFKMSTSAMSGETGEAGGAVGVDPVVLNIYECQDGDCCEMDANGEVEVYGFMDYVMEMLDRIELDIVQNNYDETGLYSEENARFVNAAQNVPVVSILSKYAHQPYVRAMMKGVMAEIIANQFMVEFGEQMLRLSRLVYVGTDIPPHEGLVRAQEEISAEVRQLRTTGLERLDVYAKMLGTMRLIDQFNNWATPTGNMPGAE